jgi:hypothetical protein
VVAQNRSHHGPRHNRSNNQDRAEIHSKLNEAARIAKAAEACALAGQRRRNRVDLDGYRFYVSSSLLRGRGRLRGRSIFTPCSLLYAASSLHEAA